MVELRGCQTRLQNGNGRVFESRVWFSACSQGFLQILDFKQAQFGVGQSSKLGKFIGTHMHNPYVINIIVI